MNALYVATFQTAETYEKIRTQHRYTPQMPSHLEPHWITSYAWMMNQMHSRLNITKESFDAPIWTWKTDMLGRPQIGKADAICLLSQWEFTNFAWVSIKLQVPAPLCLLSSYTIWNNFVDHQLDLQNKKPSSKRNWTEMFEESFWNQGAECIQACLPYIHSEWIIEAKPFDFSYNIEKYDHENPIFTL